MSGPEGFSGGYETRHNHDPEVEALLEFINTYKDIQELMAWLIESSPGSDPLLIGVKRGHLHRLMKQLGLDPDSPDALVQLEERNAELTDRTHHPKPRVEIPEVSFFTSRIKEIVREQEAFGAPPALSYAVDGHADIVDVAQYGHTDWNKVESRRGGDHRVGEWVHDVARIMADPVAYQAEFAGLNIDSSHRTEDHLMVAGDWSIQNGRHRSLAARSLGEEYVTQASMAQWIKVAVE